jgi:S-adenosylmethionine:tRNA ribosyltransferase-isomerase
VRVDDLDFELPKDLIAASAVEPRDAARLLVVSRGDPSRLEHRTVRDLPDLLERGDLLVTNDSRVVPARFRATIPETGGKAEGLWLRDVTPTDPAYQSVPESARGRTVWSGLVKARRHRVGRVLAVLARDGSPSSVRLEILGRDPGEPGAWLLAAWDESDQSPDGPVATPGVLDRVGLAPLPPYILHARRDAGDDQDDASDLDRYQTIYATDDEAHHAPGATGSVAAPTAGLHFTPELFGRLDKAGVQRSPVTLHVGTGTFKTVEAENLDDHPMHAEWCAIPDATRERIASAKRTIAVGTTAARTLEAFAQIEQQSGGVSPAWLETDLLIQPGHTWRALDGLMTNFHLPRSTLLALVAALFPEGIERVHAIYAEAIRERYRFFSFGDAMLILP